MGLLSNLFKPNIELVEWQAVLTGDYDEKRVLPKAQLVEMTEQVIADNMRIFDDSSNIINSTLKPDVMFSRLELAEECLLKIKSLEPYLKYQSKFTFNETPTALYEAFEKGKQLYINNFIVRCEVAAEEKAAGMKTEKGKLNQFVKLDESLTPYKHLMNAGNLAYIERIMNEHKE